MHVDLTLYDDASSMQKALKRTVFEEWDRVVNRNSIAGPHPDGDFTPYNDSPFSRSSTGSGLFSREMCAG